ncbi:Uncharacterized protein FWK35_00031381, partial [Aphis craccivora]
IISTIFPFKWNKNKHKILPLAVTDDDNEVDKMEILNTFNVIRFRTVTRPYYFGSADRPSVRHQAVSLTTISDVIKELFKY